VIDVPSSEHAHLPVVDGAEPRVTVAIATYNGRHLLEATLPTLRKQTFRDFRVVVVDDASEDDTVVWLHSNWPEVEVIAHPHNRGVTAALNSCLQAGNSEFVALLNNDVELDARCLAALVGALEAHPQAAVAATKLIDFYDREILDGAGDVFEWSGYANRRGQGERDLGQYDSEETIFGACAGAALYRRSAVEEVGHLDEDFFALQEDTDWSFRCLLMGFSCHYVPSAVAFHMSGATLGSGTSDFSQYHNWRNSAWVVLKNYPAMALLRHSPELVAYQAHNFVWARQTGRQRLFLRVWRDTLRAVPQLLRKRRTVQCKRTIGLKDLERVIGRGA
jgi:GT2 family glycosyltransferase